MVTRSDSDRRDVADRRADEAPDYAPENRTGGARRIDQERREVERRSGSRRSGQDRRDS